jgi:hypothetical protein
MTEPTPLPRFSVVIPAYNRADSIQPTLQSVLDQTFDDYEVIVVDDGSRDGTRLRAVVDGLGDPRIRYIHRENGGGGAARNTGVEAARGAYIAFLDSDDFFLPHKLAVMDQAINQNPDQALYSYMRVDRGVDRDWIRPDRPISRGEDVGEYLFVANQFIQTSTLVLARETALQVPFDPSLRKGQDLDLCIKLAKAGVQFRMIEDTLTIWVDVSEHGRTSRVAGAGAPTAWLKAHKDIMTPAAVIGYRATVLAYYIGWSDPSRVLKYLWQGYAYAGVNGKVIVRQAARTFLPKGLYRGLVAVYVKARGVQK